MDGPLRTDHLEGQGDVEHEEGDEDGAGEDSLLVGKFIDFTVIPYTSAKEEWFLINWHLSPRLCFPMHTDEGM